MPRQDVLLSAKVANKNEFYTQYHDIEKEVNAYVEFNKDVFRDKTILLPCDDPEWSNFTKYFAANFERFGLKKLISTSYAKGWANNHQISLFELDSPNYDEKLHSNKGKLFILERDKDGSGRIDHKDIEFSYMEEDGDFRSEEVTKLRDEADFIITNPPFNTLFHEFFSWVIESGKQFLFIASINSLKYKDVFPYIKDNRVWTGTGMGRWISGFIVPEDYDLHGTETRQEDNGRKIVATNSCLWLTNIDHGKRHEPLVLMTMADNLKYNKPLLKKLKKDYGDDSKYPMYDNYNALVVPLTEAIPDDYDGIMGVPITFLDKYNPDQFEILGMTSGRKEFDSRAWPTKRYVGAIQHNKDGTTTNGSKTNTSGCVIIDNTDEVYYSADNADGFLTVVYTKFLIKRKRVGERK